MKARNSNAPPAVKPVKPDNYLKNNYITKHLVGEKG